ncbi:MFS transporter [Sphingosinicella rhizophila]|uniref:MFS transporter n=1 Tax=Sphingosinicella rhizophila TaxID=3050082 RepID=A0ABU3QB23_9SPHN|nr:MFS transporter [Sphingosinicella sp. GR2756]MDT9600606.1 MFS transporter [Sphingosinicella sp. GR2756]
MRSDRRRAYVASLSGTALEYYDFAVYSSAAALIFGQLFFDAQDPLTGTLQAFGTYAVGYLARPIGGIFFGRLGDVIGRKKVLVATLLLVGIATFLIGLLPTYGQIGAVAPALLVLLRFAQGVGVGGEWGGAVLLSSEFGRSGQRGFWASAAQVGPPLGTLLANGVLAILTISLSEEAFLAWGWRIAFLLSALLIGFGLWIRNRLEETPVFRKLAEAGAPPAAPVTEIFSDHRHALASAMLSRIGPDVLYSMFAIFILTYATQYLGASRAAAVTAVLIGSAVQIPLIPFSGWLSDRVGRRSLYAVGAVCGAAWTIGFLVLARDGSALLLGIVGGLVFHALMYGPQAAFIAEQFPARLRYTGSSLAYTLAGIFGGAVAPLAFSAMLAHEGAPLMIGAYIAAASALTLVGLRLGRAVEDEESY